MVKMSFDVSVAKAVGTDAAIILSNIEYWCARNKANNKHEYDGLHWTYNSASAFAELFCWMSSHQIRRNLKKLEEKGYIKTGNYNKSPYDRTLWYAIPTISASTTERGSEIHLTESQNENDDIASPIPDKKHIYKNTDNKLIENSNLKGEPLRLANLLLELITHNFPKRVGQSKPDKWAEDIEKLHRIDGASYQDIESVIRWSQQDSFWAQNILSGSKLRKQYNSLVARITTDFTNNHHQNYESLN